MSNDARPAVMAMCLFSRHYAAQNGGSQRYAKRSLHRGGQSRAGMDRRPAVSDFTEREPPEDPNSGTGPRGTYGCACVSRDARECIRLRYRGMFDNIHESCECLCHHWEEDDEQ